VNNNTDPRYFNQRNVLSLAYSSDLINWTVGGALIADDSVMAWEESVQKAGYQYADFIIDGDAIQMAVRQASGVARNYHDSNKIVFYGIPNFRELLSETAPAVRLYNSENEELIKLEPGRLRLQAQSPVGGGFGLIVAVYRKRDGSRPAFISAADTQTREFYIPRNFYEYKVKAFLWDGGMTPKGGILYEAE
jgi:hypothetical protein